jgi:hypothetical protein
MEWAALARRLDARRTLDISAGLANVPDDGEFDLITAADDPFVDLLTDRERTEALARVRRLLARDGLLVIDGLYVPPQDEAIASAPDGLIRERELEDGTTVHEVWRSLGENRYEITAGEGTRRVRAWHCGEAALRESGARIAGALDERDFDPWSDRLVAVVPGWV